jgi:hypothetical protein
LSLKGRLYFWEQPEVKGTGWVFHFSNRFLGQKLLDRESLESWNSVMMENPITVPKFSPSSTYSFM